MSEARRLYDVLWREILELKRRLAGGATRVYVDTQIAAVPGNSVSGSFLVSGGQVAWDSDYIYRVSAASYYINGVLYSSPETTITLDTADATNDRIDTIVLTTSNTADKVTGTAAAQPSEPDIDPSTELKLSIVLVEGGTTAPSTVSNETVYSEAAGSGSGEWDWTASAGSIVVNSTNNPHVGSKDIEGTSVAAGVYAQGEKGTGTIDPNAYDKLILFIRSKASWNNSRGLTITLRNAGVIKGAQINIRRSGTYGFDSTSTADYQQIAIPIIDFAVPEGEVVNQVRIADFGGSIGFYIDDIKFQTGANVQTFVGITQDQADARYAPLSPSFVTLGTDPTLPNERVLTAGSGISITDGGVGSTATIAATSGGSGINQLTGDVTAGAGVGAQVATIANDAVSNAKLANMAQATVKMRAAAAGTGDPIDGTPDQLSTLLDAATDPFVRTSAARDTSIEIEFYGSGSDIAVGAQSRFDVPVNATLTKWRILADAAGDIVFDIWKDTFANYPPTIADTIIGGGGTKPTLSSADSDEDATLTGYGTTFSGGDCGIVNVDSCSGITQATLILTFTY